MNSYVEILLQAVIEMLTRQLMCGPL